MNVFDKLRSITQKYGNNYSWCEPWVRDVEKAPRWVDKWVEVSGCG